MLFLHSTKNQIEALPAGREVCFECPIGRKKMFSLYLFKRRYSRLYLSLYWSKGSKLLPTILTFFTFVYLSRVCQFPTWQYEYECTQECYEVHKLEVSVVVSSPSCQQRFHNFKSSHLISMWLMWSIMSLDCSTGVYFLTFPLEFQTFATKLWTSQRQ